MQFCSGPPMQFLSGVDTRLGIGGDQASNLIPPMRTVPPVHHGQGENSFSPYDPIDQRELSRSPWNPIEQGAISLSPYAPLGTPIAQDFRVLHHDHRETCLSPWTAPCTSVLAAGPRSGRGAPNPPYRFRKEVRHAGKRQR